MDKLRELRLRNRKTQKEMAEIIGDSQSSYSKKESGVISIQFSDIKKIESHFKLSVQEVYDIFLV